jgi:hypothetical protein
MREKQIAGWCQEIEALAGLYSDSVFQALGVGLLSWGNVCC